MDRYYVYPDGDGWSARKGESDMVVEGAADRNAAMEAVYDHRGDEREDLYRRVGDEYERVGVFVKHRGPEALWLLRADGSVYGEVDHEMAEGGQPIVMNIAPVQESSNAGEVG